MADSRTRDNPARTWWGTRAASTGLAGLVRLPYRYQPWRPRHIRLILRDFTGGSPSRAHDDKAHLAAALDWLCLAQDVLDGRSDAGGISAGWSFEDDWLPGYPETTGYTIETFIEAADALERPDLISRAHRMIDWLLSIQHSDGAFPGHYGEPGSKPVIFNTGQIMHGLLAGHLGLGRPECLPAAVRAGFWLTEQQDDDGCWRRSQHNDIPHTYDTRTSWALLRTGLAAQEPILRSAASRQLDWAVKQQDRDGWFAGNAFRTDAAPSTHTIAYAICGLLESGVLVGNEGYLAAAKKAAYAVAKLQQGNGWLAGAYKQNWKPVNSYCCLTGVAQMAINWTSLAACCGQSELLDNARRAVAYVKRHHSVTAQDPVIRGGLAGSYPIWGAYERFCYPAWAVKFFADALMSLCRLTKSAC